MDPPFWNHILQVSFHTYYTVKKYLSISTDSGLIGHVTRYSFSHPRDHLATVLFILPYGHVIRYDLEDILYFFTDFLK